jgi:hypothetical protein
MRMGMGVVEIQLHIFLTYAVDGDGWSSLQTGHFTCVERALGTHWIGSGCGDEKNNINFPQN